MSDVERAEINNLAYYLSLIFAYGHKGVVKLVVDHSLFKSLEVYGLERGNLLGGVLIEVEQPAPSPKTPIVVSW